MANTETEKATNTDTLQFTVKKLLISFGNNLVRFGKWIWKRKLRIIIVIIILVILTSVFNFLTREPLWITIDPGQRGIVFNKFGGGISDQLLGEGTHFTFPALQTVYRANITRQSASIERITADSNEFQDVTIWLNLEFKLQEENLPKMFRECGVKSSNQLVQEIITPNTNEITKMIVVEYPIGQILLKQQEIKDKIKKKLSSILSSYYITIIDVDIENILLAPAFRNIIAQTEFITYEKEQESIKLETAKKENERRLLAAETNKEIKKLEAEAIAEYNRILMNQGLNQTILEYKKIENMANAIEKWDGELPSQLGNISEPLF